MSPVEDQQEHPKVDPDNGKFWIAYRLRILQHKSQSELVITAQILENSATELELLRRMN